MLFEVSKSAPPSIPFMVAVAEVNHGFLPMAVSFYRHLQNLQPPMNNVLFFALDTVSNDTLVRIGAPTFLDDHDNMSSHAWGFREGGYNKIVLHKWVLASKILRMGFDCVIVDVDIVFLRNPMVYYFADAPACDALVVVESKNWGKNNEDRFEGDGIGVLINTGLVILRNTETTRTLVTIFLQPQHRYEDLDDQWEFLFFMEKRDRCTPGKRNVPMTQRHTTCSMYGATQVHILPGYLFTSQFYLWQSESAYLTPFTIHFNYLSGFASKKQKMAEMGLWRT